MLASNLGQIEASVLPLDILDLSSRQALNVTFDWWMERIDPEEWNKNYKHLFTSGKSIKSYLDEENKRMRRAEKGESASLNIPKKDEAEKKKVEEQDLSQFFGRMSNYEQ